MCHALGRAGRELTVHRSTSRCDHGTLNLCDAAFEDKQNGEVPLPPITQPSSGLAAMIFAVLGTVLYTS